MGKKHKHAEVIKAWADGAVIEWRACENCEWGIDQSDLPAFDNDTFEFRVKTVEIPEGFIEYTGQTIPLRPDLKGYEFLLRDGTIDFCESGTGIPLLSFVAFRPVLNKVVRWQWILSPKFNDMYNFLTCEFHTDESVVERYHYEQFAIIGKAEWTRTEFDK